MDTAFNIDMPADVQANLLKSVINPWLLGADPEFAILIPPDVIVPNSGNTAVNTTKAEGQIGSDHNGRVWELRPSPSPSAYVVATNLWKLLRQQEMDKLEKFKWKSGALGGRKGLPIAAGVPTTLEGWVQAYSSGLYGYLTHEQALAHAQQQMAVQQAQQQIANATAHDTLGGHVHFGIQQFNAMQRTALHDITTGMLNLDILPHKENTKRLEITSHSSPQYGHMNGGDAVRDCNGHVEYRCAPSWLDRPLQALTALTCYKLAAARPSSVKWPKEQALKQGLTEWLEYLSRVDVDAWILYRFLETRGLSALQADPQSDFKPLWRRESPW